MPIDMSDLRCLICGDRARDGHLTCGRVQCSESLARDLIRAYIFCLGIDSDGPTLAASPGP